MKTAQPTINILPRWVTSLRGDTLETAGFSSGAALALLDVVLCEPSGGLPAALLRERMGLNAAVACLKLEGRNESPSDIRDAVCLARPGDALGPAGEMFLMWRNGMRINLTVSNWRDRMLKLLPEHMANTALQPNASQGSPVAQAANALADCLQQFPRQEAAAMFIADVTLARAMGWNRAVPLHAAHLKRSDVRAIADGSADPLLCVHQALIGACDAAIRAAADLSRRATRLEEIKPKLRAKGAEKALAVFLNHDAVSPSGMLSPRITGTTTPMTDRAARRLCDRLVELGVVHELTGRPTFRLYGV